MSRPQRPHRPHPNILRQETAKGVSAWVASPRRKCSGYNYSEKGNCSRVCEIMNRVSLRKWVREFWHSEKKTGFGNVQERKSCIRGVDGGGVGVRGVLPNTKSLICTASHEYRIARSLNALSSKYVGKSNTLRIPYPFHFLHTLVQIIILLLILF